MRKEFSESPDKVVNAPLYLIFLVDNILLEKRAVWLFVRFKSILCNFRCTIILSSVIDRQINESTCHSPLINVLKILQDLEKITVIVGRKMTKVIQKLPWLQHFVAFVKIVYPVALLGKTDWRIVKARVREHQILEECSPHRNVRCWFQRVAINQILCDSFLVFILVLSKS